MLKASAIAFGDKGVLIIGRSGSGKSTLAMKMISLGSQLVADDQTVIEERSDGLYLKPLDSNSGMIESRYVGIFKVPWCEGIKLSTVVDLSKKETKRLPPLRTLKFFNQEVPCIYAQGNSFVAQALNVLLSGERLH